MTAPRSLLSTVPDRRQALALLDKTASARSRVPPVCPPPHSQLVRKIKVTIHLVKVMKGPHLNEELPIHFCVGGQALSVLWLLCYKWPESKGHISLPSGDTCRSVLVVLTAEPKQHPCSVPREVHCRFCVCAYSF